ncbi:RNA polymerase sigma factor [Desulfitispora alkaliphila]|uniref:RNA polymerase sigma-I factor n=1 Tax=Desulfitispora alkaliphila TaxID=622674 RepID=UPI003D23F0CB
METVDLKLLSSAQQGDAEARDKLIAQYKPFITKIASEQCRRYLDWSNDDELSIALIAFNKAIDNFDITSKSSFTSFAKTVIKNSLIDYFRVEGRHRHVPLSSLPDQGGEIKPALSAEYHHRDEDNADRATELLAFQELLLKYGFNIEDLVASSPKHRDTKERLHQIAKALCLDKELLAKLKTNKQLPVKELEKKTGFSKKILQLGRRYIIAIALIMTEELYHLQSFVQINMDREGAYK